MQTCFHLQNVELHLPPKPTTTPAPYVYTTAKPRRNKQQHHQKNHHENKGKDALGPNQIQRENEANSQGEGESLRKEIFLLLSGKLFSFLIRKILIR